jgi:hypothetical protein
LTCKSQGFFLVKDQPLKKAAASAVLYFDADRGHAQAFAVEVRLQSGQQLPQFGGHGVGAHQQTPSAIFNGSWLDARSQGGWQQAPNGLQSLGRLANPSHQE